MTRILVVDDDPSLGRAISRFFTRRRPDFLVASSRNGVEARNLMTEQDVDLVLTDLRMPEMDGFELLAWILNHRPAIPVFTMTAFGDQETIERLNGLGSIECFAKPLDVQALLRRLSDAVAQSIRGHVQNVSLASFLQLMEMERKTCTLSVECGGESAVLYLKQGQLIDAKCGTLEGEEAAITAISWPSPAIDIVSHCPSRERRIESALGFVVMEAMRIQDEAARLQPVDEQGSQWPPRGTIRPSSFPGTERGDSDALEPVLPVGTRAIALVEAATGKIRRSTSREGFPVKELARMAAQVFRKEMETVASSSNGECVEELVLSTKLRCDVIRPVEGADGEFALLVFAPEETNLVMARLELDRFLRALPAR